MAFIYNLTDSWNDVATTWNGIKLAVTDTGSSSTSKLLNLTISGSSSGYFYVDKSGNLTLSGSVNKITMTAPATGATLTLADGSSFITSGAYSTTFTTTGTTTLTLPTSGTVTALGNTTTGSGSIVLATSPTLTTPNLGVPTALTLTNATGLPISTGLTGTGSGVLTALAVNVGSAGAFVTFNGALGTPSSGSLVNCSGYPSGGLTGLGTGVATALSNNVGSPGAFVVNGGALGTPSSGTLTNAIGLPLTTGVTGTLPVANGGTGITSFGTGVATALGVNVGSAGAFVVNGGALGTPSSGTLTNATGLPISTGVSGLGTGVATFLATPSSANLASAVTDETGSGPLVFATAPTFGTNITVGTASSSTGIVNLKGTTSGTVSLSVADAAGTWTMKLPTSAGTNGYYLQTDGLGNTSWAVGGGGGGGSPGGSSTQIQYNNAGAFGGSPAFTFNGTTTVGLGVASTTSGIFNLYNSASANAVSIKSGNNVSAWSLTLPTSGGSANYFLQTDGSGNTTWAAAAAGTINTGTVGQITYYSGTSTLSGTTTGTGVLTALGINTGSAGAFVVNGGALGTPSSGTLTSCTGLPLSTGVTGTLPVANGGTGITSFGTGVATALGNNTNGASGLAVLNSSGYLDVAQGGTGLGSLTAGYIPFGNGTSAFGSASNLSWDNTNKLLTVTGLGTGGGAATGGLTVSGGSFGLSGNISANAWTTSGIRYKNASATLTDLTSTGTVAAAYTNVFGGNTIAASNATTFTDYFTTYISEPTAGTNVTFTNKWALGITGNVKVSGSLTLGTALSVANGGTGASSASITAFNNITGYTATGATGTTSTNLVFSTSPTLVTPTLGVASATSINKVAITAPATSATLTIADGKTLTANNSITFAGTDSTTMTFPSVSSSIGYLNIPQNSQTSAYVAAISDVGKHISITTGGVTVNASVFSAGDVFTIYNNSSSNQTITAGTNVTFRLAGTATTGNRTLAQYGVATLLCTTGGATPTFVVSGGGVT